MAEETIFSKIIRKEIPADIIYQDDLVTAFRDISPQAPTHILIIPNKVIPTVDDVETDDERVLGRMVTAAAGIARDEGIGEKGYRLLINCKEHGGQEVYHLHMHLLGGATPGTDAGEVNWAMRRLVFVWMGAWALTSACGEQQEVRMDIPDDVAVARGRDLYEKHGCGSCHGREGRGDGPISIHLDPRPRDFADAAAYRNGRSVEVMTETLRTGLLTKGKGMPGYPHLEEGERWLLARYVAALRGDRP